MTDFDDRSDDGCSAFDREDRVSLPRHRTLAAYIGVVGFLRSLASM
jgi:hypothetical protein